MNGIAEAIIRAVIVLIESAPEIVAAIKEHPDLDEATKAELVAKVEAARAKVNAVVLQDL